MCSTPSAIYLARHLRRVLGIQRFWAYLGGKEFLTRLEADFDFILELINTACSDDSSCIVDTRSVGLEIDLISPRSGIRELGASWQRLSDLWGVNLLVGQSCIHSLP